MISLLLLLGGAAFASPPVLLQLWDFESDDGGFLSEGDLPQWEWGAPGVGPTAAYSGSLLWGTELDGQYLRENRISLTLSSLDLTGISDPVLVFWSWLDLAEGDFATIETFDGVDWQVAAPVYGYPADDSFPGNPRTWEPIYFDLSGLTDTSQLRLVLESDAGRALGWYVDDVSVWSGDAVPPNVEFELEPVEWSTFDTGPTFLVSAIDDRQVARLSLLWALDGGSTERSDFTALGDDRYLLSLPAQVPGQLTWTIEASDGQNTSTWPVEGEGSTRIFLPAPLELTGPTDRSWGTEVPLSWTAPESEEPIVGYRVYRDDEPIIDTAFPFATAPAVGPLDTFRVSALFDTALGELEGDLTDPITIEVAVPRLEALSPASAWQGEQVHLVLTGSSLLLDARTVLPGDLYLGEGIEVVELAIEHVDRATVTASIDPDAPTGLRDAWLTIRGVDVTLPGAFEVLDGSDRPEIASISPDSMVQGDSETVLVTLTRAPQSVPGLSFGDGVVIGDVTVDGAVISAEVSVARDAPLGARRISVDDGQRIIELDEGFRVRAYVSRISRCQAAPSAPLTTLLPLVLMLLRRRR